MERKFKRLMVLFVALAIIFGLLDAATVWAVSVTRGPYIQNGATDGMTIMWRTDTTTTGKVWYGTDPNALSSTVSDSNSVADHQIRVTGLSTDTKYFYQVGTDANEVLAGPDPNHYFITNPTIGSTDPFRIWVLGDSGTADSKARSVRNAYFKLANNEREADIWLMLGDNAYSSGSDVEFQAAVFDMYPTVLRNKVLWPTQGNHANDEFVYYSIFDLPDEAEGGGLASGTEWWYSFDYGNIHFICLNSHNLVGNFRSDPGSVMYQWLEEDIVNTTQDWIIAYWHHPPYSKGSNDSDSSSVQVDMREIANPILEAGGVDLVLAGHSHSYERSFLINNHYGYSNTFDPNVHVVQTGDGREDGDGAYQDYDDVRIRDGTVYVVAGSSGLTGKGLLNHPVMYLSERELGSLIIDVNDDRLHVRFLREDIDPNDPNTPQVDDYFTIIKIGDPDYNADCEIDRFDLGFLTDNWLGSLADLNTDRETDMEEFSMLAAEWRTTKTPWVDAGPNQTTTLPDDTVSLGGTVSCVDSILWEKISGPNTVTFDPNAFVEDPNATFPSDGFYVLRLTGTAGILSDSDEVAITVTCIDTTPPSPDPMRWLSPPIATGARSILLTAMTASDPCGVEYYFNNVTDPNHDSGWQASTTYEDTGLTPATTYTYQIKARDLSFCLNETGYSRTGATTTDDAAELFCDNFSSGDFATGGWTVSGTTAVGNQYGHDGQGAGLRKVSSMEKALSTAGYSGIHVTYWRITDNMDAGEFLFVEWWDGASWNVIEQTQDTSWGYQDITLDAGADNNADFKLRFRTNADRNNERSCIDNVCIDATP